MESSLVYWISTPTIERARSTPISTEQKPGFTEPSETNTATQSDVVIFPNRHIWNKRSGLDYWFAAQIGESTEDMMFTPKNIGKQCRFAARCL